MQTIRLWAARIGQTIAAVLRAITTDGYVRHDGDRAIDTSEGRR